MIKALALVVPTIAAGALSLAGCPPSDPQITKPNSDEPGCIRNVTVIPEPDRSILDNMSDVCIINVYMDPDYAHGGWPYKRCREYWGGTYVDPMLCVNVRK